ncbi:MAG TPA: transposase [Thermodesulfobacteriota bacterium]|nr:transposase [Thermodesulfobacteriota bacterium]
MRKRQTFSREFKLEAIRLLEEGKKPGADIARELGIRRNQLYKWKEQRDKQGAAVFPGEGRRSNKSFDSEEIARLKSEVARVKEENEILKKAAAFFARELK